jgi:hypothetical protein
MKMFIALWGLIVILAVSVCLPAGAGNSEKSFLNAEAILAAWESTYASITTMRVSYVHRLADYQPLPNKPAELGLVRYEHVERVEHGKRYHMRFSMAADGFNMPENLMEHAFNGKNTQEYWGSTTHGSIVPGLTGRGVETTNHLKTYMLLDTRRTPANLKEEYPSGIPTLARILKWGMNGGKVAVRPSLESVAGQLCHVVEVTEDGRDSKRIPRQIKHVLWMAHDRGMCLMKYQWYWDDKLDKEIEVEQIAAADMGDTAIWYPQKAHRTKFSEKVGTMRYELTVTDFVPNVEVDESTFRFDFPPGTDVHDRVLGLSYVVAGTGSGGEVPRVSIVEPVDKEQLAKQATKDAPDLTESTSSEEGEQLTDKNKEGEEVPIPVEPVNAKDSILSVKTISILGVGILAGLGLLLWYKRSART